MFVLVILDWNEECPQEVFGPFATMREATEYGNYLEAYGYRAGEHMIRSTGWSGHGQLQRAVFALQPADDLG